MKSKRLYRRPLSIGSSSLAGAALLMGPVLGVAQAGSKPGVATLDSSAGLVHAYTDSNMSWDAAPTLRSHTRAITVGGNDYLLSLDGQGGRVYVNARTDTDVGTLLWEYPTHHRWTAMDTYVLNGTQQVVLFDGEAGVMRTYDVSSTGTLSLDLEIESSNLADKQVFDAYVFAGNAWFFAMNRFDGTNARGEIGGASMVTGDWSNGWSHVQHVERRGKLYRLLYKQSSAFTTQPGRLYVQEVTATGSTISTRLPNTWMDDYTDVTMVGDPTTTARRVWIIAYRQDPSRYYARLFDLDSKTRIVNKWSDAANLPFDRLHFFEDGTTVRAVAIDEDDGSLAASASSLEAFDQHVDDQWISPGGTLLPPAGFQVSLRQYGRLLFRRVEGLGDYSGTTPVDLERTDNMAIESVSKVITGLNILKLAEMEEIDVDVPFTYYLDWGPELDGLQPGAAPWFFDGITIDDLLRHESGVGNGVEAFTSTEGDTSSAPFVGPFLDMAFVSDPTCATGTGPATCGSDYENGNVLLQRLIYDRFAGGRDTAASMDLTYNLWMSSVYHEMPHCLQGEALRFQNLPATPTNGTYAPASGHCGARGWKANTDFLSRMLSALRYEQILGPTWTDEVRSMGAETVLMWTNSSATSQYLSKNGTIQAGASAVIATDHGNVSRHLDGSSIAGTRDGINTASSIFSGQLGSNF
ncbi:MAG: serine hydrolase [Myxococcota bacterium]